MSLLSVHAWSLVIAVMSVLMIATIVVVVLLAASDAHLFHGELEPRQFGRLFVDIFCICFQNPYFLVLAFPFVGFEFLCFFVLFFLLL